MVPFEPSVSWLNNFQTQHNLHNIKNDLCDIPQNCPEIKEEISSDDENINNIPKSQTNPNFDTILQNVCHDSRTCDKSTPEAPKFDLISYFSTSFAPDSNKLENNAPNLKNVRSDSSATKNLPNVIKSDNKCPKVLNYGLNVTALMDIKNKSEKSVLNVKNPDFSSKPKIIDELEHLLTNWLLSENKTANNLNLTQIQEKALTVYEELKQNYALNEIVTFNASFSWLVDFKKRFDVICSKKAEKCDKLSENINSNDIKLALDKFEEALKLLVASDSVLERKENTVQGIKRLLTPYYDILSASGSKQLKIRK